MIEIEKLNADLKNAVKEMSKEEANFLVKTYYTIQDERIGMFGRVRELAKTGEPNKFYDWLASQMEALELRVKQALSSFAKNTDAGEWLMDICGIGPVIASGLIASLDIGRGQNPSSFWKYAGLAPGQKRARGEKINYNPDLKRLCFLIGESFVKVQSRENDFYGKIFREEKDNLIERNLAGEFKEAAEQALISTKFGKDTDAFKWYSQGILPPAHIHARARRFVVKIFLCHVWQVMWWYEHKTQPKMPWVLMQPGHSRFIDMPNKPF